MKAIFEREIDSYYNTMMGYIIGAFMMLFIGIFTMAYNLTSQSPYFEYALSSMSFLLLVLVPILTMRSIAEERRQKTDQLLYSLPIGMTKVVVGKYLAMLVVVAIPLLISCAYPAILTKFGTVHLAASYSCILAFFLLTAALLSIGLFISSLTENQAVSAGICFVVMLLIYFITSLSNYISTSSGASLVAFIIAILVLGLIIWLLTKNITFAGGFTAVCEGILVAAYFIWTSKFESLFPTIMTKLSLFDRYSNFTNGIFDVTTIVYDLSVIAVFLFLTVQSMEKRRWS